RVDLASGTVSSSKASAAAVPLGPVGVVATFGRALGNWIAPSAMAKNFLEPGVVASPDGTRIYAIGVVPSNRTDSGSAGVFVFDAATLSVIGHWNPTADFASIAISADGRYLYAAARAGVDADGHAAPTSASITVYDTTDGSIRLIAGDLGSADLSMVDRTVR
ncbi:MAG: hypothetical protein ABI573_03545, partial [Chloroflexota bacterium]